MIEKRLFGAIVAVLILTVPAGLCQEPKELTVFAAASLTGAFGEIGEMYENGTGIHVTFNFDGSQALATQMTNGAYADVFASANNKQMNVVKKAGLMNTSSIATFTRNTPALVVPVANPGGIKGISDLNRSGLKIVIGTDDVPIGDYTRQILDKLENDTDYGYWYKIGFYNNVVSRETNVNYIVSKVALGEADAGIAYKSDVTPAMAEKITKIEIPAKYNVIAEYPMGALNQTKYPAQAEGFMRLVRSDEGRAVLEKYGFDPVASTTTTSLAAATSTRAAA
ncbi:MAG TPA: molybdate ABC transporter substrate-binding protein [Methanotrichaceae archaeon]|nr:molybdate ABC transporter substrate-binding protein [Methanotrichaceae archaeon]